MSTSDWTEAVSEVRADFLLGQLLGEQLVPSPAAEQFSNSQRSDLLPATSSFTHRREQQWVNSERRSPVLGCPDREPRGCQMRFSALSLPVFVCWRSLVNTGWCKEAAVNNGTALLACSSFPKNKETVCPGSQHNLPNGGGMPPPPKFLWSPKLLASVGRSREQDLREGPRILGSTWSEFVFLAQWQMTFSRSLGRFSSFPSSPSCCALPIP